jgi:trans-aconitate methyltransferase
MEWNPHQYLRQSQMQFFIGKIALSYLQPKPNEAILDLGCGIGTLTTLIAEKTTPGPVIGIDVDPQMITFANSELKAHPQPNLSYLQQDGVNLTYHDQFNAIFSNIVLHWVKPLQLLLDKLFGALKNGGRIQIATIFDDTDAPLELFNDSPASPALLAPKIQIHQIENRILQEFMTKGHYKDILPLEVFQTHQRTLNPNLTYNAYKLPELAVMITKAGFTGLQIAPQTFWHKFDDLATYLAYRRSNIWLYFLSFFPARYRPQLVAKLCQLIQTEWDALPAEYKEFPIKEKWPVLFIRAVK